MNEVKKRKRLVPQDNPVPFKNENICFTPDELMEKAMRFPKNSVIVFDEGKAGLDAISSMSNINKGMQDFFSRCGFLNHVIINSE